MGVIVIECATCGEPCGKQYPATHEEPGFREGIGENFALDSEWFCSQKCLDECIDECRMAEHADERPYGLNSALRQMHNDAQAFIAMDWE